MFVNITGTFVEHLGNIQLFTSTYLQNYICDSKNLEVGEGKVGFKAPPPRHNSIGLNHQNKHNYMIDIVMFI